MAEQIQSMLNDLNQKFESSFTLQEATNQYDQSQNPQKIFIYQQSEYRPKEISNPNYGQKQNLPNQQDDHLKQQFLKQIQQINQDFASQTNTPKKKLNQYDLKKSQDQINHHYQKIFVQKLDNKKLTHQLQNNLQQSDTYHRYNSEQPFVPYSQGIDQQQFSYKELTLKLEKALQKISSQKKISSKLGTSNIYQRFQQYEIRKNKEILKKREQKQIQQVSGISNKPLINQNSRIMFSGMKQQPLFQRIDRIVQQKKKKQLQYQAIRKQKQEKQYQQYLKEYNQHMEKVSKKFQQNGMRSNQEYFDQMARWLRKKQENIQNKKNQKDEKLNQQLAFKPQINKKSEKIMKKSDRVPIYQREVQVKLVQDQHCTFKPKINKTNIHKKYSYY